MTSHRIYADTPRANGLASADSAPSRQQVGARSERDERPDGDGASPARTITLTLGDLGYLVGIGFVLGLLTAFIAVNAGIALGSL